MAKCGVCIAAYSRVEAALEDWERFDACSTDTTRTFIDAALVETDSSSISVFHRFSLHGDAHGAIAAAVLGLLSPTSLVTGALAGGVGEHVLGVMADGLDRAQVKQLGDAMDRGYVVVVVVDSAAVPDPGTGDVWPQAEAAIGVESSCSVAAVTAALRADSQSSR